MYDETKECIIIDAGCQQPAEQEQLKRFISEQGLRPVALVNTHCHFDHVFGNSFVCDEYKVPSWTHREELRNVERFEAYASLFGAKGNKPPVPTHFFEDGADFKFGNSSLKVLHTPGHSPGGVCFYSAADKFLIAGDTLFAGSIGRTDLPGGDYDVLMDSLKEKVLVLPSDTKVYCGHGPETSVGIELQTNPFITEQL